MAKCGSGTLIEELEELEELEGVVGGSLLKNHIPQ